MTVKTLGYSALSAAIVACIPLGAQAQLEEVVVTAQRRETSLQDTPLSIQAFTGQELEFGGIDNGRDLGIMVPNVVLNPGIAGATADFYVRGLPGVGIYVDGVWQGGFGFQTTNFLEMERVEVLRGPQGTLFGRNTNGGAVQMVTRRPADEFGARVNFDVGTFNRRDASIAVDLPITDRFKTKWMGASLQNDGFLEGVTANHDFGAQDDTMLRADLLWEPTDSLSFRFTMNDEERRGTDPRIHSMTRFENSKVLAYNVMLGAFQADADAACAGNPTFAGAPGSQFSYSCGPGGWAPPPAALPGVPAFGARITGEPLTAFTPATHSTGYPNEQIATRSNFAVGNPNTLATDFDFGAPQLDDWQTRSDSMLDGVQADTKYYTLTVDWDINDNMNFWAVLSDWEQDQRTVIDFDGTEFIITTDDRIDFAESTTLEMHLSGQTDNGRISWLAGYYNLELDQIQRFYRWAMWDFVIPNTGSADPNIHYPYAEYVRDTAYLLNLNGEQTSATVNSGGNLLTPSLPLTPNTFPYNITRYPWMLHFISSDTLNRTFDDDEAFFGEVTFGATENLDITLGYRRSDKNGGQSTLVPIDALRTADPDIRPQGDYFVGINENIILDAPTPKIDTYKFAVKYQFADTIMGYASYSEGFTSAEQDISTIGDAAVTPAGCVDLPGTTDQVTCNLQPEVIETIEIGLRSDLLDGRLRFNATYFDSEWLNMRIVQLPFDQFGNTQPFPYDSDQGSGTADGFEFEIVYAPTDRLVLNLGLGLIDTNYIQAGVFDGFTGNFPGAPFAYASETSGTLGATYQIPMGNGGQITLVGNYGFQDDYARDAAYQRTKVDDNGNPLLEPGYGILNARLVYEPPARNYKVELWGRNLTDEQYVNGGFDTRDTWGYDFSIIGRSREVGVSLGFEF